MKKNRILSSLLCLSLAAGLLIPGLPAYAEGEGESGSSSGMELSKTAVANDDGTYTITLEAYATGQKVINKVERDVPTDIVLVLDQSGSMSDDMSKVNYGPYDKDTVNSEFLKHSFNDGDKDLYYCDDAGVYYPVSVGISQEYSYKKITNGKNNSSRSGATNYWNNRNNLYALVNGEYQKVTLTQEEGTDWWDWNTYYVYRLPNGTEIARSSGDRTSPTFTGTDDNVLYLATIDDSKTVYTYTYVVDGNTIVIGSSTGANNTFEKTLYKYGTLPDGTRRDALKKAVDAFAQSVATKAAGEDGVLDTDDDIDHRVAVVGFASQSGYGNNTELLSIAGSNSGRVGVAYGNGNISDQNLKAVLQDMSTQPGQDMVTAAINALDAEGATRVDLGMDMAQKILAANPVPEGQERNRVVVVFTDGAPTSFDGFDKTVANNAITKADAIKKSGATVYSVGIFPGADPTSPGTEPSGDLDNGSSSIPAASNWFMQKLSSNNGTPQTPSFYLSAADANTLTSIFQQIANNIETGGSSTTLDETAVIKDIISPQFTLPAGATTSDITLETYQCTGKNNDVYTWTKNADAMGAAATVNGDQVSVTGFDFADNYVGTVTENGNVTYRGNKLVISFTVSPKDGFLGGNNVYTNTSAGVYENANAQNPVLTFDRPQVNVPIKDVTVTAEDKNVYLLNGVTLDALKNGTTVDVGGVNLDLSAENYGLESWQNEYVDITVQIKDEDGKEVTTPLSELKDDTTYTITVTVAPKTEGANASGTAATAKSGEGEGKINVYKPELTYKDSEVFYGDAVPTNFDTYNRTATKWKHGETEADTTKMGAAPALTVTYTPDSSKIDDNNKIASKDDIQVAATVKIDTTDVTGNTTFVHTDCAEGVTCSWNEATLDGSPAFLLHVKTATLTITKAGDVGQTEGFIFNVVNVNDASINFRVSVKGNGSVIITGLPLGTYTVTEDTGWSWRYQTVTITDNGSVTLTEDSCTAEVTVTNTKTNDNLLDGSAYAQNNSKLSAAAN